MGPCLQWLFLAISTVALLCGILITNSPTRSLSYWYEEVRIVTPPPKQLPRHPWPSFRGPHDSQFGASPVVVPPDLKQGVRWMWQHPQGRYSTVFAGGPVVDIKGNIYLAANDGIRKFGPGGKVLWYSPQEDRRMNAQPALWNDTLFTSTENGFAHAINVVTGRIIWARRLALSSGSRCTYPSAYDGVFVVSSQIGDSNIMSGGDVDVFGLNASTGRMIWRYTPRVHVWTFAPVFTRKGTVIFMDFQGGVYCLGLHNGTELWYSPSRDANRSFSAGGAVIGLDRDVFACSNPGDSRGDYGQKGLIRRLNVTDGTVLWSQILPQPCDSFPAVGTLGNLPGHAVVVTPGSAMGSKHARGSMMSFNVLSGAPMWRYNADVYIGKKKLAKGDADGFENRSKYNQPHPTCSPAHWSAPSIDGHGVAFASRADGILYGVFVDKKDAMRPAEKGDALAKLRPGFSSSGGLEVRKFTVSGASLHGSWAFGYSFVAVATCDLLFVFNDARKNPTDNPFKKRKANKTWNSSAANLTASDSRGFPWSLFSRWLR